MVSVLGRVDPVHRQDREAGRGLVLEVKTQRPESDSQCSTLNYLGLGLNELERRWRSLQVELILGFKTGQIMEVASLVKGIRNLKQRRDAGECESYRVI